MKFGGKVEIEVENQAWTRFGTSEVVMKIMRVLLSIMVVVVVVMAFSGFQNVSAADALAPSPTSAAFTTITSAILPIFLASLVALAFGLILKMRSKQSNLFSSFYWLSLPWKRVWETPDQTRSISCESEESDEDPLFYDDTYVSKEASVDLDQPPDFDEEAFDFDEETSDFDLYPTMSRQPSSGSSSTSHPPPVPYTRRALQQVPSNLSSPAIDDRTQACPICLTNAKDMAFNCGHMTCQDCSYRVSNCPICRQRITVRLGVIL